MQINESELQIRLEKDNKEMMWSDLGVLLPGNAEITPRSNDTLGEHQLRHTDTYSCKVEHEECLPKNSFDYLIEFQIFMLDCEYLFYNWSLFSWLPVMLNIQVSDI